MDRKEILTYWSNMTDIIDKLYKAKVITREDRQSFDTLMDKIAMTSIEMNLQENKG